MPRRIEACELLATGCRVVVPRLIDAVMPAVLIEARVPNGLRETRWHVVAGGRGLTAYRHVQQDKRSKRANLVQLFAKMEEFFASPSTKLIKTAWYNTS